LRVNNEEEARGLVGGRRDGGKITDWQLGDGTLDGRRNISGPLTAQFHRRDVGGDGALC